MGRRRIGIESRPAGMALTLHHQGEVDTMRYTTIALIEFHWLPSEPARERRTTPKRTRAAAPIRGYYLPGGSWRAFLGDEACCGGSPIVFLHVVPDDEEPAPRLVWHRRH